MAPPAPRFRRLDPDARREQILDAAREAFTARPYEDVSLSAVARAAGVSRTLVSHYFGGKRELFAAVRESVMRRGEQAVRVTVGRPIEETVERNVAAWLDFAEANREVTLRLNVFASGGRDAQGDALLTQTREGIVDTMLRNQLGTTDAPPQVRLALRAYTGMVQVAVAEWLLHERATREQVHVLMVQGLLALMRDVVPRLPEVP